jgi:nucleoside triphosphate pyrophosphatase
MLLQNRPELILASSSPRRVELLRGTGVPFQAHAPHINEDPISGERPLDYAARVSREKAEAVAVLYPQSSILSADTIVVVDGQILGKPLDHADAIRMLRLLSARGHEVTTAVTLIVPGARAETRTSTTKVFFRAMTADEIQQYVAGNEPMDKAGAYAIQGGASLWTDRIEGEYSNVVGLPLSLVTEMLRTNGLLK